MHHGTVSSNHEYIFGIEGETLYQRLHLPAPSGQEVSVFHCRITEILQSAARKRRAKAYVIRFDSETLNDNISLKNLILAGFYFSLIELF